MQHRNDQTDLDRQRTPGANSEPSTPRAHPAGDPWTDASGVKPYAATPAKGAPPPQIWDVAPSEAPPAPPVVPPLPHTGAPAHPSVSSERQAAYDQRYAVIVDLMQHGAWPNALLKLKALRVEYADAKHLDKLIAEAELKAELMEKWAHKIRGRRLTVNQEWFLRRSLPFMLVLGLFLASAFFYQTFLAPTRQVLALARAAQTQVQEAKTLVQTGDFVAAMSVYQAVLANDPTNLEASAGLVEAQNQLGLAANYDIALHVIRNGNLTRAEALMRSIRASSPAYRDVDQQLGRLATLRQAEDAYLAAEEAFAQRRWASAIEGYERAGQISSEYRNSEVQAFLQDAYFFAGEQLLARWPTNDAGPEQARTYLRRVQNVRTHRAAATELLATLDTYFRGQQAVRDNNLSEAINLWRYIYDQQPDYLGGFLAEQLYRAYITLATQATVKGDLEGARQLYDLAQQLQVRDTSEAVMQLALVSVPTPGPTSTPAPPAPVVYYAPQPAPEPTATPTPAMQFSGWIAFRSTREGGESVFVMQPDGANVQRAPEEIRVQLNALYEQGRRSPDGTRTLVVSAAPGRSDANLYIQDHTGQSVAMITDDNGDEYDPVWAPNGQWIAYVANHPGNDEIFLMRADGSDKRRLTWNEWEWDKHPTWSPDSTQIAFYTNRTGPRQIWVMSYDGTNARNISNSAFDDWDPVWLR